MIKLGPELIKIYNEQCEVHWQRAKECLESGDLDGLTRAVKYLNKLDNLLRENRLPVIEM